ncbi:hypothetical protein HJB56_09830 [Rhizobium lentis]|uniref:hypothetical protein n=1 Tax=Rhizobium lentis TaxID=1138194 RepID=UPI001C83AB80|nr:hypothetical protein [Rhizobium lentis]MBX5083060.1 hypothetical protein [Rhizobium lentis]MBX5095799.1 hypothetical protein [Rhizobium lentis]MBX5120353.1 hypothetical protein [Rhizobium lentis]
MAATFKAADVPAQEFIKKYPKPVLLAVQPDTFKILTDPDDLKAWEQMLSDQANLKVSAKARLANEVHASGGTCCESNDTNDCDED